MNKLIKILILLSILLIVVGFNIISNNTEIFNDVDSYCCDNGLCENTNPNIPCRCNSASTVRLKTICNDISITCRKCVDYTVSGCVCQDLGSDFCMENDYSYYYGVIIPCDITK